MDASFIFFIPICIFDCIDAAMQLTEVFGPAIPPRMPGTIFTRFTFPIFFFLLYSISFVPKI